MNLYILEHRESWSAGTLVIAAESIADVRQQILELHLSGEYDTRLYGAGTTWWNSPCYHLMDDGHSKESTVKMIIYDDAGVGDSAPDHGFLECVAVFENVPGAERGIVSDQYHSG